MRFAVGRSPTRVLSKYQKTCGLESTRLCPGCYTRTHMRAHRGTVRGRHKGKTLKCGCCGCHDVQKELGARSGTQIPGTQQPRVKLKHDMYLIRGKVWDLEL